YPELAAFIFDVWNEAFSGIAPGVTVRELQDAVQRAGERRSPSHGRIAGAEAWLVMRGCGLGSDAPVVTRNGTRAADLERVIAPRWCIAYTVRAAVGRYRLAWGDTVEV